MITHVCNIWGKKRGEVSQKRDLLFCLLSKAEAKSFFVEIGFSGFFSFFRKNLFLRFAQCNCKVRRPLAHIRECTLHPTFESCECSRSFTAPPFSFSFLSHTGKTTLSSAITKVMSERGKVESSFPPPFFLFLFLSFLRAQRWEGAYPLNFFPSRNL